MRFKLPAQRRRTPWGALFWALPVAYIFLDPYQRGASSIEWVLTALALAVFLALYTVGLMFWDDRSVLSGVCAGVFLLAVVFFAFRYSGAVFFNLIAAFAPFIVGGRVLLSVGMIAGLYAVMWLEWWLVYKTGSTIGNAWPISLTIQGLIVAAGTTFMARQIPENERDLRVAERERIARDLHDVLGHTLSSIALKSELAGRLLYDRPERALAEINDVERISRAALEEVREAIHGYHAGDIRAEFDRAESMLNAAGIQLERHFGTIEMAPTHERVLALALREAVTNVVRHAEAKLCRLALYRYENGCRLEIRDDGRGGVIEEGIGVRSIRTRVEALGGRAVWQSDRGTRLVIDLPLELGVVRR